MTRSPKIIPSPLMPYSGSEADNALRIALDVGEGMLKNGAEVHRVEVTVELICRTYGAAHVDVFTINSLIIAALCMPDGSQSTQTRRIFDISNNLSKIEMYNTVSRKICSEKPSFDDADAMIRGIKQSRPYPVWLQLIGYILAAGGFAVFFGGTIGDGIAAGLIGAVIFLLDSLSFSYFNKMVKTLMISFCAGILSCLSIHAGIGQNMDMVIIGTIMLLIPGLSLGNAMRDLLGGDTMNGTLKVVQAVIIALMIAIGYSLSILIAGGGL